MNTFIYMIDDLLLLCTGVILLYWFILAVASHCKHMQYSKTKCKYRCVVLIPEENQFSNDTNEKASYELITYKNLQETVYSLDREQYDIVILLSNVTGSLSSCLIEKVCNVYDAGIKVIQLHTVIKERKGIQKYIQALCEEINNSLFRAGNTQLGFSSNLYGTNMAIDLTWLQNNLKTSKTNLERKLFRQNIYIEYLPDAIVYCNSIPAHPYRKRTRKFLSYFFSSLFEGNWNFCNRIIQQLLPSPTKLYICASIWTLLMTVYDFGESFKWWIILFGLAITCSLAIPDYLVKEKKRKKLLIWKR